uniref:Farnesyltransferase, CAAX box, subunit beta n=1 Tax=Oncorhynchus mykiss TaxID=8022 RepID=A0A8K9XMB3_ONCMY
MTLNPPNTPTRLSSTQYFMTLNPPTKRIMSQPTRSVLKPVGCVTIGSQIDCVCSLCKPAVVLVLDPIVSIVCVFSLWCLDASRPWLCYWILHSLELLEEPVPTSIASERAVGGGASETGSGGRGVGDGQWGAGRRRRAVGGGCSSSRCDVVLNPPREKLLSFLFSVKQTDGSFVIHGGGEVDIRSAYCAASVAPLTNIMTPTLFQDTPTNWEGGLGGVPGLEAHGGYTFCGTAAVVILGKEHMLDLKTLLQWVASRHMRFEGWFQGRCNKLVDGCYSFWQVGVIKTRFSTTPQMSC